jgi:hypothetical protein
MAKTPSQGNLKALLIAATPFVAPLIADMATALTTQAARSGQQGKSRRQMPTSFYAESGMTGKKGRNSRSNRTKHGVFIETRSLQETETILDAVRETGVGVPTIQKSWTPNS